MMLDPSRGQDGFFIGEPSHINSADSGFGTSFVSMSDPEMHHVLTSLGHVDAVLPVLHGPYGEDGTVQGLLEMMGVPYVGCGVFASAACMDKHYTKVVLDAAGIPTAPGVTVDARNFTAADVLAEIEDAGLTYPLFVKPSRAGSSFGVTKVEKADDRETQQDRLAAAIATAGEHDWKVLAEQGIDGREIECAVLCPKAGDEPEPAGPAKSCSIIRTTTSSTISTPSTWMPPPATWKCLPICRSACLRTCVTWPVARSRPWMLPA